ncbi:ligase-associated DNA damage response endonuclease PdeM [Chitinophaga pendula]|uniref:ligase-associated DNA damage response endonuclease PdeM n=1 Tax=Chitinophaga TaxID=79328 RepID=UPI0018DF3945|nr:MULTISPECIES: ligase-associated DNA damage response endonuclease PdeM [Chitinophaga]UCJ07754.1 ligase-associated DNA damage response endonuclease PdeM [Chitinophaga pendula]
MEEVVFHFKQQQWRLLASKAIYWEEEQALIVSDLHLGKSAHFRKAGIAVPANIIQEDLYQLQQLITRYCPQRVIVVGDMFHSSTNNDVEYFRLWRRQFLQLRIELVKGNHDILPAALYASLSVQLHDELTIGNIRFIHEPCDEGDGEVYTFSGHIHPGMAVSGQGRQRLRLPCFYFGRHCAVLPAFGKFTGLAMITPEEDETVFVIANKDVIQVSGN